MIRIELLHEIKTDKTILPAGKVVLLNCPDACILIQIGWAKLATDMIGAAKRGEDWQSVIEEYQTD